MTWDNIRKKYTKCRDEMSVEEEERYVNDCFSCYENEGFSKVFWSCGGDYKQYHNKPFTVIERATLKNIDLECLPMWKIRFEDGFEIYAYPDEIIPREMKDNGYKMQNVE